ncbi:MAG: HU family DNA-binding protein [Chloroflexi bacterium]|nr:HU family DNA-binding protein [Chloroflexota bacterium]
MDELVKVVVEKTGLPEAQAKKAADAVLDFLKEKLPAPLAGQLDNLLENPGVADQASNVLGSLFGKK